MAQAYILYSEAAALDPTRKLYWLRSQAVRSRAALQAKPTPPNQPAADTPGSSENPFDPLDDKDAADQRKPLPPPELNPKQGRRSFNLRGDVKSLFESVTRAFELDTIFDSDFQTGPQLSFHIDEADYREALHALEAATGSFVAPLSAKLLLVVKDSEQKRREVEPTVTLTMPLPDVLNQPELNEIAQGVRQIMTLEHLAVDTAHSTIVIRDRLSKALPARRMIAELIHARAEVEIQVDFIEMDRTYMRELGLELQTSFPFTWLGHFSLFRPSIPSTITRLATFGGGKTLFGVGIVNAQVFANMSQSRAQTLLRIDLRSADSQPATFHVGDRYPVITGGYFGSPLAGQGVPGNQRIVAPPPAFQYEDLGVILKVTPRIHGMEDISLDIDTEFKVLAGQAFNGIPVISNRKLNSKVTLRDGEWGIVAGMLNSADARAIRGLAGLSTLPVIGPLIRKNTRDESHSEVLIVVKPRLLRLPADQFPAPVLRVGSETRPLTPL